MAEVDGTCEARFEAVRQVLVDSLDAGRDVGASVVVRLEGRPVVDIWGGHADGARTIPWDRDTITNVWSTTKTMTFLCALMLADRGELDFYAPVRTYWPEFAAGGKEAVEVRHIMSHTAGLAGFTEPLQPDDLADWEKCTSLLAAQKPWWEPGTAAGYHAVTQGYLIGEVVRRITGVSIGTWFASEVAGPLGADFSIGLPPAEDARVSPVIPPGPTDASGHDPTSIPVRVLTNPLVEASMANTDWWRRAEIPAANGHGNARSVAAIQDAVAGGGETAGVRLLSEKGCDVVFEEQSNGTDLVLQVPMRMGMGYGLSGELVPMGPRACFWGGYGGSLIVMDQDMRLTVCYVMNRMEGGLVGDLRGPSILMAAVQSALQS